MEKDSAKGSMDKVITWVGENAFKPGGLATILVLFFLGIFIGVIPSPMLDAIAQVTKEHNGIMQVLRQICVNTAKDQTQINYCYYSEVKDR